MDLFDYMHSENRKKESPLAARIRPLTLEDFVGQKHIIAKDKLLYRAIASDQLRSIIFYGPPGTGKTTLAQIIANTSKANFVELNATTSGKKDIVQAVEDAKTAHGMTGHKTILFIDEIHRFNKAQQDALLPHVEDGTVILIGATTENPYFEVNGALLSRSQVFELYPLTRDDIKALIVEALADEEKGLGAYEAIIQEEALEFLADIANGDARAALNAIELAVTTTQRNDDGKIDITLEVAQECIQKRAIGYDKGGDQHYDTISAFIKSMRGSDPDATVYYLARMIYAGEDPKFIARRIIIAASEDVGNADPQALVVATNAMVALERVGMPEGRIILSQAAIYVALAPKSNRAYLAINQAMSDVKKVQIDSVPNHLRDGHYKGARKLGRGVGYQYPHDYPNHYVDQQYLPDELVGKSYYELSDQGYEKTLSQSLKTRKESKL